MKVGFLISQSAADGAGGTWSEIRAVAQSLEAGGADSIWVCDHFFVRRPNEPETGFHEVWTILSALAAVTERVELGTLVLATSFRSPGLLAKMAVTADDVAGGRLILGVGCGWHEPEYDAFGVPFDHRVGRFDEALQVLVPLVRGDRVTLNGRWTQAVDAVVLPPPRRPGLPIMVAATGDRMLRLTARHADAWQTAWYGLPDERYLERRDRLLAACEAEGRDPSTLEVTVGLQIGWPTSVLPSGWRPIALEPSAIADGLSAWAAEGVGHIQVRLEVKTEATFDVVLDGIRRFRGRR